MTRCFHGPVTVAQLQDRLQRLIGQRTQLDAEIATVLDEMKAALSGVPVPKTPQSSKAPEKQGNKPKEPPPAPIPPGTMKDRTVLYLGRNQGRYVPVAEIAQALGLNEAKVQFSLRDTRAKAQLLEAPQQNTWKLNVLGLEEYRRLEAAHRGHP